MHAARRFRARARAIAALITQPLDVAVLPVNISRGALIVRAAGVEIDKRAPHPAAGAQLTFA